MSHPTATKIISDLQKILKRAESLAQDFKHAPLFALWVSTEEPSSNSDANPICEEVVASYLRLTPAYSRIERGDVTAVGRDEWISRGMNHWSPFYAFCKVPPQLVRNDLSVGAGAQLGALAGLFADLEREISEFPKRVKDRYRLPEGTIPWNPGPDWWRLLFHLAIHYPCHQLRVGRHRWLTVTEAQRDGESSPPVSYSEKASEHDLQLEELHPVCADVWPGTIWCELENDIATSTVQAIELLVRMVEQAYSESPVPDPASFAGILARFEELAGREPPPTSASPETLRLSGDGPSFHVSYPPNWGGVADVTFALSHADQQIYGELSSRCIQPHLVRLGSHCSTPHLTEWCKSLAQFPPEFVTVARWDSSVEFVAYRNMPPEFRGMCEEAGALLPERYGVVPALPAKVTGWEHHNYVVPVSDPMSRWLRFVFETTSASESDVTVHFPPLPPDGPFGLPPYGSMQLKQGFFRASAMAIRAKFPSIGLDVEHAPVTVIAESGSGSLPPDKLTLAESTLALQDFRESRPGKCYRLFIQAKHAAADPDEVFTTDQALEWIQENLESLIEMEPKTFRNNISIARGFCKSHGLNWELRE
jgi:hypothetical protein